MVSRGFDVAGSDDVKTLGRTAEDLESKLRGGCAQPGNLTRHAKHRPLAIAAALVSDPNRRFPKLCGLPPVELGARAIRRRIHRS